MPKNKVLKDRLGFNFSESLGLRAIKKVESHTFSTEFQIHFAFGNVFYSFKCLENIQCTTMIIGIAAM